MAQPIPETQILTAVLAALPAIVEQAVVKALAAERERQAPRLLTQAECAKALGVSVRTLANYEARGCPVLRPVGGVPRYDLDAVLAWMQPPAKAAE